MAEPPWPFVRMRAIPGAGCTRATIFPPFLPPRNSCAGYTRVRVKRGYTRYSDFQRWTFMPEVYRLEFDHDVRSRRLR